jgi:hypothetical protein
MKHGYIKPSKSPYGSPILFMDKKDKKLCMCIDYHTFNKLTIKNNYPLPRINDFFDCLNGASYFNHINFKLGYYHICVKDTCEKTSYKNKKWFIRVLDHVVWVM